MQAAQPDSSAASNSLPGAALHRDAKAPTLTMLRWARPVSRPRTWPFAARSARPCRAARGSVDQGRLPRGSSVPLRWVPIPRNDSFLFAPAPHPGKNARQRAQLRAMPWKHPPPLGRAAIAPTIYGASGPNLDMGYARLAAYRKEENSSPNPHTRPLGSSRRPEYRATSLASLGTQGNPSQLLSETHNSRSALEYGDTAMSASARVTECLNEDRG